MTGIIAQKQKKLTVSSHVLTQITIAYFAFFLSVTSFLIRLPKHLSPVSPYSLWLLQNSIQKNELALGF
ncbi:hypothetical protein [Pedobacter frigiditerrae]|uniref:hypothetical protein n=1 Tax=Pedobacter frigiditerrae TaxID=2530452 RepID=UPI00292ECABB|nr:hypothetical protein [Pedobacter frigiditerrae]